ncbi:hypothetical protein [Elioraea rosea]|uniref:hypothetical protein n=1 Tax=Elioraea rosea TaxID=2492390 RepID=UPI0011839BF7|nr:hypothetical protein [Elioraea rosea]
MRALARFVVSLLLCAGLAAAAAAAEQQELTRSALEGLAESAKALQRGDSRHAAALLEQMTGNVATLSATAERYREAARSAEQCWQARSIAIIGEIEQGFGRQQALEAEEARLSGELRIQREQAERDRQQQLAFEIAMHALAAEANFRNRCSADIKFYFDNFGRCFGAVAETVFTTRDQQIRNAYNDINRQRMVTLRNIADGEGRQRDLVSRIEADHAAVEVLRSRRAALEQQDAAVRRAITTLSDVTQFWSSAQSLLGTRVANQLGLLNDLLPTLERTKKSPVFDRADRDEIKSLRRTLLDFAKSVDDQSNFLLAPTICQ